MCNRSIKINKEKIYFFWMIGHFHFAPSTFTVVKKIKFHKKKKKFAFNERITCKKFVYTYFSLKY